MDYQLYGYYHQTLIQYLAILFLIVILEIVVFGYAIAKADDIVGYYMINIS